MSWTRLPTETISHIASYLPYSSLISASMVCKKWRIVFTPNFYRSVRITKDSHIAHFSRAINSGGVVVPPFCISRFVRSLSVSHPDSGYEITDTELVALESCITNLAQLRRFDWSPSPQNSLEILKSVQTQCPLLESVSLYIPEIDFKTKAGRVRFKNFMTFRNLIDLSLTLEFSSQHNARDFSPFKTMLENCPRLQSLEIHINFELGLEAGPVTYDPDFIAAVFGGDLIMPYLHTLRLRGDLRVNAATLFGPPTNDSPSFRDFLSRHPNIKDLEFAIEAKDWSAFRSRHIDPEQLGSVLPSLKRLHAPTIICIYLVRSTVAAQLEYLEFYPDFRPITPFQVNPMPKLRELRVTRFTLRNPLKILEQLIPAATGLEVLRISRAPYDDTTFLELLSQVPNLREIDIHDSSDEAYRKLEDKIKIAYPHIQIGGLGGLRLA